MSYVWTPAVIHDMIIWDVPNVCECIVLGLGLAILFFGRLLEPQDGLYCHEAQELADEFMRATTWVGLPAQQQAFPMTVTKGWWAIALSHGREEQWEQD